MGLKKSQAGYDKGGQEIGAGDIILGHVRRLDVL